MAGRKLSLGLSALIGVNKTTYPGGPATDQDILDWIDTYRTALRNALGLSEAASRHLYPAIFGLWLSWGNTGTYAGGNGPSGRQFPTNLLMDGLVDRGIQPMFMSQPNGDNTSFVLKDIVDGKWDTYLDAWAQAYLTWAARISGFSAQCNNQSTDVLYRFAWEMDVDFMPWAAGKGSPKNTPLMYRKAFIHVSDRIRKVNGATGVKMVWCPWGGGASSDRWKPYYPGTDGRADAVQFTGFDSYASNTGTSMVAMFGQSLAALKDLAPDKDAIVSEFAVAVAGSTDAQRRDWIKTGVASVRSDKAIIRALVYFDVIGGYGFYDPPNGQNQTQQVLGWATEADINSSRIWE